MREVLPQIWTWSSFSTVKQIDFNGFLLLDPSGNTMVDPPVLENAAQEQIRRLGPPGTILLTNKDHVRMTREYREHFQARVGIHELDAPLLDFHPDFVFRDGATLPGSLRAIHVPDSKSPGETAFWLDRGAGVLILGDALIGKPPGELCLLPPEKYADVARARRGVRNLLEFPFDPVLVGDGTLIPSGGRSALQRFLEREDRLTPGADPTA